MVTRNTDVTGRMCDCDGVIGLRERPPVAGETAAAHLLGWLRELPTFAPHVARVAVLRAWSPPSGSARR